MGMSWRRAVQRASSANWVLELSSRPKKTLPIPGRLAVLTHHDGEIVQMRRQPIRRDGHRPCVAGHEGVRRYELWFALGLRRPLLRPGAGLLVGFAGSAIPFVRISWLNC